MQVRRRAPCLAARTPRAACSTAQLSDCATVDCAAARRREVQGSSFYQRLRSACASTAHHALLHPSAAPPSSADSVVQSAQQQASPGEAAAGEEVSTGPAAPSEPLPAAAAAPPAAPWPGTVRRLVCYGLGSMQDSRTSRYQVCGRTMRPRLLTQHAEAPPQTVEHRRVLRTCLCPAAQLALLLLLQSELLPGLTRPPEVGEASSAEGALLVCEKHAQATPHASHWPPPQVYDPVFQEVDLAVLRALGLEVLRDNNGCATRAVEPTFFYLPHLEVGGCGERGAAAGVRGRAVCWRTHV